MRIKSVRDAKNARIEIFSNEATSFPPCGEMFWPNTTDGKPPSGVLHSTYVWEQSQTCNPDPFVESGDDSGEVTFSGGAESSVTNSRVNCIGEYDGGSPCTGSEMRILEHGLTFRILNGIPGEKYKVFVLYRLFRAETDLQVETYPYCYFDEHNEYLSSEVSILEVGGGEDIDITRECPAGHALITFFQFCACGCDALEKEFSVESNGAE